MIMNWVSRFRAAGPDALRPHKKGRKKTLDKSGKNLKIVSLEEPSVDTSAEHVKELRRLRLEDEAKTRERQGSSAVSEDSSD